MMVDVVCWTHWGVNILHWYLGGFLGGFHRVFIIAKMGKVFFVYDCMVICVSKEIWCSSHRSNVKWQLFVSTTIPTAAANQRSAQVSSELHSLMLRGGFRYDAKKDSCRRCFCTQKPTLKWRFYCTFCCTVFNTKDSELNRHNNTNIDRHSMPAA